MKLQFLYDDGQVARLVLEKYHGPTPSVTVRLEPFTATERSTETQETK